MTILNGLDASYDLTRYITALKQQKFDFVMRYYSHTLAKNLSRAEALALSNAGLTIGTVWETSGTDASFFSGDQGRLDGAAALLQAKKNICQPEDSAIYFAVDYDALATDISDPISDYFQGIKEAFQAASVHYQIGVYGSGDCCASLLKNDLAQLSWLSQSTGFSGSKQYASELSYNLIQLLPHNITVDGPHQLNVDFNTSNEGRPTGLFQIANS